jgi:hypothetical protein
MRQNAVAWVALFVALGGTSAYAANTIRSGDIVDNEITTTDVRDDSLGFGGLFHQDLAAGSVRGSEIENFSIGNGELITGSADTRAATDNSLTGADINESTLNLPARNIVVAVTPVGLDNAFTRVASRVLSAGSYSLTATVNLRLEGAFIGGTNAPRDAQCELRNGADFIGGAVDARNTRSLETTNVSLAMNGGANVPAGGGEVSLWCRQEQRTEDEGGGSVESGQVTINRLAGFF